MAPTRSFTTQQAAAQIAQADEYWNGDMGDPADNGFRFSGQQIVTSIEALTERRGPITLTKEDFSMSPVLDKSQSPEFSEPYRLLAPLVLLSFPSIALPSLHPSEAPRSWRRRK